MKIYWRIALVALATQTSGAAIAADRFDAGLRSPSSFDQALGLDNVELVAMAEPTPAEAEGDMKPADAAPAPAASSTVEGCCDSIGCGDGCCDDGCCGDSCCGDSCCDMGCGDMCGCCPVWTFRGGAVILERDRNDRTLVIEDRTGGTAGDGFADAFDFGWTGGVDLGLIRMLNCGRSIEARFFGGLEWEDTVTYVSAAGWAIPTNPPRTGTGVANLTANYKSRLNSFETNLRSSNQRPIILLAGFRYINLEEAFNVAGNFGANQTEVAFNTQNNLFGGQIGAESMFWQGRNRPITGTAWIKAGVYGNDAEHNFSLVQAVGPDLSGTTSQGQVAFVGDIAITGSYWFNNNVSLRTGYQLLWVEGVAIATDQIAATNILTGQGIDTDGEAFYHGALVSLDFIW